MSEEPRYEVELRNDGRWTTGAVFCVIGESREEIGRTDDHGPIGGSRDSAIREATRMAERHRAGPEVVPLDLVPLDLGGEQ